MKKIKCILLIDDDVATNNLHKIIIDDANVTEAVHAVTSGQEALDYLTRTGDCQSNASKHPRPDLIFLDINMPAMNGFEFMEAYSKLDEAQKSGIIVMMLTTSLNPDDEERSKEYQSIFGFRNKPLTEEMLHEIIDNVAR